MTRQEMLPARIWRPSSFIVLAVFLGVLWVAGGASRADVPGQFLVRGAAWSILVLGLLLAGPPRLRSVFAVATLLFATVVVVSLQLLPLPPAIWTALPGRDLLIDAVKVSGQEQPWRPLSISPGATVNALSSLIVPVAALLIASGLDGKGRWRSISLVLVLVLASAVLGLLQFSGASFDHPLINDVSGAVSASFANRNHFALFLAVGCLLAPIWGFGDEERSRFKGPLSIGLMLIFGLMILATGSRTGMLVGALGIGIGLFSVRVRLLSEIRRLPRNVSIGLLVGAGLMMVAAIVMSVHLGRAVSLERAFSLDVAEDLRRRALPTVWSMVEYYFPFGTGVGTFDPAYRIHEPEGLLSPRYFNHAHNDWLEIVLDGGVFTGALLVTSLGWWIWKSVAIWRSRSQGNLLAQAGAGTILLILIASITDYPARTPMVMALGILAAVWLSYGGPRRDREHGGRAGRKI